MPYTNKILRPEVEEHGLQDLSNYFVTLPIENAVCVLNQIIFSLVKRYTVLHKGTYFLYNNLLGSINEAQHEIRRRMVAPYEEKKIEENGDIV